MKINKYDYKKGKRLTISFLLCIPIFIFISYVLYGASTFLIVMINLVISGTIMFTTVTLGEKKDIRNAELHERYVQEKERREKLIRLSKGNDFEIQNNLENIENNLENKENDE